MKFTKGKLAPLFAEFLATALLTLIALHVGSSAFFTALTVGTAMGFIYLMFGHISGGHANPAVTIGLWTLKKIQTTQAIAYIAAQLLGAISAWSLNAYLVQNVADSGSVVFSGRSLVAEVVGTAIFTMGIAAVITRRIEGLQAGMMIGTAFFLGIMTAFVASKALLNPALMVGVQAIGRAYVAGPILGSVIGMNLYAYFFGLQKTRTEVKHK